MKNQFGQPIAFTSAHRAFLLRNNTINIQIGSDKEIREVSLFPSHINCRVCVGKG